MYYDLIASLPRLPHFEHASRLPITSLRLNQRLQRLKPTHADQLKRARALLSWRPSRLLGRSDQAQISASTQLSESPLETSLRDYVAFRIDLQTLLAALRRKRQRLPLPEDGAAWGAGPWTHAIARQWDAPDFGLVHVFPWLPSAQQQLAAGDARALERLLMDLDWRRLGQYAERNMFGFEAVFAYVFKWDILQDWLACDAERGQVKFTELIDEVTYVEGS